jgi:uncharacterized membrane protein
MNQPRSGAPPALTVWAIRSAAGFALAVFLSAIVLHVIGSDVAERAALLGVVATIATPAVSLLATAIEQWSRDRATAWIALIVVGVLAVATGVALFVGQ